MTKEEMDEINLHHILGKDKWLRMFYGLQSDLIRYEGNIAHIVLKTVEESNYDFEAKVVGIWRSEFERKMQDIKGYVIYHYRTNQSTGFNIQALGIENRVINTEINKMKVPENLVLLSIYSGLIDVTKINKVSNC
jgi:hypothetical protein